MFCKLALKNIRRSIKDYAIYFFTLALGVAIFYVFNALDSQSIMLDVNDRVKDMLDLMNTLLGTVSVFVATILGGLIIYASHFLIKRRSKEFGIYLTLGMSKRKISLVLLLETLFIGIFSLVAGLILGILASQFVSALVANMFDADLTSFRFVLSAPALIKTLVYFGIIYIVVMIFNTIVVGRQKLISLLSSSRRGEKVKMKNPWLCTIVFAISAIILGVAYYLVTDGINMLMDNDVTILLIPISMGIVATFLFFWSLSGLLLRIFISFKKVYFYRLNAFTLRQFSSKINTTVASMSMICLMLFVTICVLGTSLSINKSLHTSFEKSLPADVQITSIGQDAVSISEVYARENIDLDSLLKNVATYKTYRLSDIMLSETLGVTSTVAGSPDLISEIMAYDTAERFIYLSDYNRIAPLFGLAEITLAADEYAILANYEPVLKLRNAALKSATPITVSGETLRPKFDECIVGSVVFETQNLNDGLIIVADEVKLDLADSYTREYLFGDFIDMDRAAEIEEEISSLDNRFFRDGPAQEGDESIGAIYGDSNEIEEEGRIYYYNVETRQAMIDNSVGMSALVTFIGLYIGIIFLISSAAILALKELSESSDNRRKYDMLRRLGASEKMLHHALFWQIFIFFLFPLLVATLHSIFGLKFCNFLVFGLGGIDIVKIVPGVSALLVLIYGGYFLITYFCSKNIIRPRRS